MQNNPHRSVTVFLVTPGFVDVAEIAGFIFGVKQSLNSGGVAVQSHYRAIKPGVVPGASLACNGIRLVADCEARVTEIIVATNEIGDGSIAGCSEGGVPESPGWLESHSPVLIGISGVNHIPRKIFSGIEALFFVGPANADEGISPGVGSGADVFFADLVIVYNDFILEAALLVGSIFCISRGINLINNQDGTRVCVEHGKGLPR